MEMINTDYSDELELNVGQTLQGAQAMTSLL